MPAAFTLPAHATAKGAAHAPAIIDDTTPTPEHARYSGRHAALVIVVALGLWAAVMALLASAFGWGGDFTQMGWFFTKAAFLTFGGAYAVLPYVVQGAVEEAGWLTAAQMIDGLALGESTPGPLIMIVAYVGFMGGWSKALLGPETLFTAGALGATVATWFTFLPSFLFILAGGPLVERTRDDMALTAPLTAITAAVVGVIVNLAVFFALHVFWTAGRLDLGAIAIAAAAFVALTRLRQNVMLVIALSAAVGLVAWAARA